MDFCDPGETKLEAVSKDILDSCDEAGLMFECVMSV